MSEHTFDDSSVILRQEKPPPPPPSELHAGEKMVLTKCPFISVVWIHINFSNFNHDKLEFTLHCVYMASYETFAQLFHFPWNYHIS